MPYVFGSVYCATKAALHGYTDTLRLELAPFDVRVVNVITGGVKSNIARTERALKPDSIYLPVQEDYERRLTHSQSLGVPTDEYAKTVVAQVTGTKKETIWAGARSWLIWWLTGYMPKWVLVSGHPAFGAHMCPGNLSATDQDIGESYVSHVWPVQAKVERRAKEAAIARPVGHVLKLSRTPASTTHI